MSRRFSLTSRDLMRTFGLAAASLPLLDVLGRNTARADGPVVPKRLVCIVVGHGIFAQHWLPWVAKTMPVSTESPGNFLLPPSAFLQKVDFEQRTGCTAIDLAPFSGDLSPAFGSKWQAVKKKTAFIHNLGCSNKSVQGHTMTAPLCGYKNDDPSPNTPAFTGESLDVVIARKLTGRLPLLLKAPDWLDDARYLEDAWGASIRKTASGFEMLPTLRDPIKTWDKLFADYVPPDTGPKKRDPSSRRVALLDHTLQNIARLEKSSRLSAHDKQRLDQHAGFLEAQRASAAAMKPPPVSTPASPPARPTGNPGLDVDTFNAAKGTLFKAQFKNAAAALKMNKEPVITINSGLENEWLTDGLNLGGSQAYHGSAGHLSNASTALIDECRKVHRYIFDVIADFLVDLDQVEDPATGATYLDNTLVLITPEHDGRPNGHLRGAVPSILAGGFGTFTGGKIYDYSRPALWQADSSCIYEGFSYSRLVLTVLQAFGVTAAERATMDIQGFKNDWSGADVTDFNVPLTGLT